MSLDLYLRTKTPIKHKIGEGKGNYSSAGGFTRVLSYDEVKKMWPDYKIPFDPDEEYEDDEYWWANITHNLGKMASHCPTVDGKYTLYELLWRPSENGFEIVTPDYIDYVKEGFMYLLTNKTDLLQYNPPIDPKTGERWGNYELLVDFVKDYIIALCSYSYEEELTIYASV